MGVEPPFGNRTFLGLDQLLGFPQILYRMIPVHHPNTPIEVLCMYIPDPPRSVGQHLRIAGLTPATPVRLAPRLPAKGLWSPKVRYITLLHCAAELTCVTCILIDACFLLYNKHTR